MPDERSSKPVALPTGNGPVAVQKQEGVGRPNKTGRDYTRTLERRCKRYLGLGGPRRFTTALKVKFLEHYATSGLFIQSALAAGVSDVTVRSHIKKDEAFAAAFEVAEKKFLEHVESEVYRRGIKGWLEPIVQKGEHVRGHCADCQGQGVLPDGNTCPSCNGEGQGQPMYVRRYSDRLLELLAKRHIPEYREKVDVNAKVEGGVVLIGSAPQNTGDFYSQFGGQRTAQPAPPVDAEFEEVPRADESENLEGDEEGASGDGVPEIEAVEPSEPRERPKNAAGSGRIRVER